MKTALLKHYGKILLTVLALGVGAYFHVDVSKFVSGIAAMSEQAPVVPNTPDAGQ